MMQNKFYFLQCLFCDLILITAYFKSLKYKVIVSECVDTNFCSALKQDGEKIFFKYAFTIIPEFLFIIPWQWDV